MDSRPSEGCVSKGKSIGADTSDISADDLTSDEASFTAKQSDSFNVYLLKILPVCVLAMSVLLYAGLALQDGAGTECPAAVRKYYVYDEKHFNVTSILKHVHVVLRRFGWQMTTNASDWDLLWTYAYPFGVMKEEIANLREHQRVNHFPGCGYFTNKLTVSKMNKSYVPKSFKLPSEKEQLLEYARSRPNASFVRKKTTHREISIQAVEQIDLDNNDIFIQEFKEKPFLVDGHKFDIGIYVVVTSVNPLRAHYYKGDILFRYCPEKYYPFDARNVAKYVVEGVYRPTWKVPALSLYHSGLGFGMKDSFEAYLRAKGLDPAPIWKQAEFIIADVLLTAGPNLVKSMTAHKHPSAFFELVRFDMILDEEMRLHLMEANMSPNLFSGDYHQNRLLYEQVLYSVFSLSGLATYIRPTAHDEEGPTEKMISALKNVVTWANVCLSDTCREHTGEGAVCALCRPYLDANPELLSHLHRSYKEHLNRADTRRIFPPSMSPNFHPETVDVSHLSVENSLLYLWYQGKCNVDDTFCS